MDKTESGQTLIKNIYHKDSARQRIYLLFFLLALLPGAPIRKFDDVFYIVLPPARFAHSTDTDSIQPTCPDTSAIRYANKHDHNRALYGIIFVDTNLILAQRA
jgi:hypothetical protein